MIVNLGSSTPRIAASAFVAPSADIIGDVEVGENASIWFQVVLRGDVAPIRVGANTNIQDGAVVHGFPNSPVTIGNWVTVGHRAVLHACTVEDHCLIGIGAIVLNNARIGEGSIVAAGALVVENAVIPPHTLYLGAPARLKRQLTEADRSFIDLHAVHYLQYRERYLSELGSHRSPNNPLTPGPSPPRGRGE
jgi:carbonic anhydrase/acetyltransferase-like protein (isoleucine patch superfamily)